MNNGAAQEITMGSDSFLVSSREDGYATIDGLFDDGFLSTRESRLAEAAVDAAFPE